MTEKAEGIVEKVRMAPDDYHLREEMNPESISEAKDRLVVEIERIFEGDGL